MSIYQNTKTHLHHIVPRRKGGTDDPSNLIELTVYDHAIAHRHLWKMYGEDDDRKAYCFLLAIADKGDEMYVYSPINEEQRKKLSESLLKHYASYEARKKTSLGQQRRYSNQKQRDQVSAVQKQRYSDPDERRKTSEATKRGIAAAKARRAAAPQVS